MEIPRKLPVCHGPVLVPVQQLPIFRGHTPFLAPCLKTPSFITVDLEGTTSLVLSLPLGLWHSFLSELDLLGVPTRRNFRFLKSESQTSTKGSNQVEGGEIDVAGLYFCD